MSVFKNVLIITDNIHLSKKVEEIINDKNFKESKITFSISPFSSIDLFQKSLKRKIYCYDLKKEKDLNFIQKTFDLVISIQCKQFFPKKLIQSVKCINVHPGYNPINRGWYPQVFSILHDLPIGATIHEMDDQLDHGNIIVRELIEKTQLDTSLSLYNKVIQKEIELFEDTISCIVSNNYKTVPPESGGNLFLKKDFKELLELDLSEKTTVGEVLKRLRALSHGDFKNAYYFDSETKKKIYISIVIEEEK